MNEYELFLSAIALWPDYINVGKKIKHPNGGVTIPALTEAHNRVEELVLNVNENYMLRNMDWAIYTKLHFMAREADLIFPKTIKYDDVKDIFKSNLSD